MATLVETRSGEWETVPATIPQAGEDVYVGDTHVIEIHLVNDTASAASVTITDKQGTPVPVIPTLSIAAHTDQIWELTGRLCKGGIHWSCTADATVVGYMRGR